MKHPSAGHVDDRLDGTCNGHGGSQSLAVEVLGFPDRGCIDGNES
jgi:hypothetical protein